MPPPSQTPQEAVSGLIGAYCTRDIDAIVQSKDFDHDSRIFWKELGLPISPGQLVESRAAFETNFRNQMKAEMPDYSPTAFRIVLEEHPRDDFAIITLVQERAGNQKRELRIPILKTDKGWKVVLHPEYDHL